MYLLKNEMSANKMCAEATKLDKGKLVSHELRQKRKFRMDSIFQSDLF